MFLGSGDDQFVPDHVDKEALMNRWKAACAEANVKVHQRSGLVPYATHELKGVDDKVMDDLVGRVREFLQNVEEV